MQKKERILIINDDGIYAEGLKSLWRALVDLYEVIIIAPVVEQSGVGGALTLRQPLHIDKIPWEKETPAWKITGTPTDCVRMGLSVLLDSPPDLIVSGVNRGSNSGRNVFQSGTLGGVIDGSLRKIPGIAFSCEDFDQPNYRDVEKYITPIVQHFLKDPLPEGTFLNVTFPLDAENVKGFKMARQGKGYWIEDPDERIHPEGQAYYWLSGKWDHYEEEEESDVALLKQGYVTAVPLHVAELTDHRVLKERKSVFEKLFD